MVPQIIGDRTSATVLNYTARNSQGYASQQLNMNVFPKKFINTWWSDYGSGNCSNISNMHARNAKLVFIPFDETRMLNKVFEINGIGNIHKAVFRICIWHIDRTKWQIYIVLQTTKPTISHPVDNAHVWCYTIKFIVVFMNLIYHDTFKKIWLTETANNRLLTFHIIGFVIGFYSDIHPAKATHKVSMIEGKYCEPTFSISWQKCSLM